MLRPAAVSAAVAAVWLCSAQACFFMGNSEPDCSQCFYRQTPPQGASAELRSLCHSLPGGRAFATVSKPPCDTAVYSAFHLSNGWTEKEGEELLTNEDIKVAVPALLRGGGDPSHAVSPTDSPLQHWDSTVTTLVQSSITPQCSTLGGDLYILTGVGGLRASEDGDEECQTKPLWSAVCCAVPEGKSGFSMGLIRETGQGERQVSVKELEEIVGVSELFSEGCGGADGVAVGVRVGLHSEGLPGNIEKRDADGSGATEEVGSGATEKVGSGVAEEVSSGATEEVGSGANEKVSSGATEEVGSGATEKVGSGAAEDVSSGATEEVGSGANEKVGSGVAEEVSSGATEEVGSGATEKVGSGAAEDVSSGAAEDVSSGATEVVGSDVVEEVGSDVAEEVGSDVAEKVSSDVAEKVGSGVAEEVSSGAAEDVSSDATEDVSSGTTEAVGSGATEEVGSDVAEEVGSSAAEEVSSGATEEVGSGTTEREDLLDVIHSRSVGSESSDSSADYETVDEQETDTNGSSTLVYVLSTTMSILKAPLRPVFSTVTQLPGQVTYVLREDLGVLSALPGKTFSLLHLLTSDCLSWMGSAGDTLLGIGENCCSSAYYCSSSMAGALWDSCHTGVTGMGTLAGDTVGICGDALDNAWWVTKFFGGRLWEQSEGYVGTVASEMGGQAKAVGGGLGRLTWRSVNGVVNVFRMGGGLIMGMGDMVIGAVRGAFGDESE